MEKTSAQYESDLKELRSVPPKVNKLELELATHEVQCEERWKTCFQRLTDVEAGLHRIESRMTVIGGTLIMFLAGVLATLISKG
tara:strand:+ start:7034 stop:7285 length:252 start_codon:yes stop_codon:yes gene_type:complete